MKLTTFSITNYRSITTANKIPVGEMTILIGKNNEGKSNILKGLRLAMSIIESHARLKKARIYHDRYNRESYIWERDFPIAFQSRKGNRGTKSIFKLVFNLTAEEVIEFKDELKMSNNGTIIFTITFDVANKVDIVVSKQGKGSKTYNENSRKITEFVANKLQLNYIEAVRTEQRAYQEIRNLVSSKLLELGTEEEYIKAVSVINRLQQEKLDIIASQVEEPLKVFLPNINSVEMKVQNENRNISLSRDFEIIIDDGNPTGIETKGEGIKSLVTLALLKNKESDQDISIIAIEEPESHLHPGAIAQLENVIGSLANENQVIITTHNPIFVNRTEIKSNIIIDGGKARAAKNLREIRDILGIRASDNLMNAKYVLVVEGEDDKIGLTAILKSKSEKLKKSLDSNTLVIDFLGGASNLSYKLSLLRNALCQYHVLLDNDEAGRDSWHRAINDGYLLTSNSTMTICNGMTNSEFEDCIDKNIYKQKIYEEYGVNLDNGFGGRNKWSDRMKNAFYSNGKLYTEQVEKQVKWTVAKCIEDKPINSLCLYKGSSILSLIENLESMIK